MSFTQLAISLDLRQVIVAGAAENTANPGQTGVAARIWDDEYALLCKVAETPNPAEPAIGRTVYWGDEGAVDGDMLAVIFEQYRDESRRGDTLRVRTDWGKKDLFLEMGYLLSNITA